MNQPKMPEKKTLTEQDVRAICNEEILKYLTGVIQKQQPALPTEEPKEYIWQVKEFDNPNPEARNQEINDWLKKMSPEKVERKDVSSPISSMGKTLMNIRIEKPKDDGQTT